PCRTAANAEPESDTASQQTRRRARSHARSLESDHDRASAPTTARDEGSHHWLGRRALSRVGSADATARREGRRSPPRTSRQRRCSLRPAGQARLLSPADPARCRTSAYGRRPNHPASCLLSSPHRFRSSKTASLICLRTSILTMPISFEHRENPDFAPASAYRDSKAASTARPSAVGNSTPSNFAIVGAISLFETLPIFAP